LLSYLSNVSFGGTEFSCQRAGMVNGFTHVAAFAGDASAVAVAPMSTVCTPKTGPISVATGLFRLDVRNTFTFTRLFRPVGPSGNVTSPVSTSTAPPTTRFSFAVVIALLTAGPPGLRSS
jgi:hypothetical protein